MQSGEMRVYLNRVDHSIIVADHLFDVVLTPRDALVLLGWLQENLEVLKALAPEPLPATTSSGDYAVALQVIETESEIARRGRDWEAEDINGAPLPAGYDCGR